MDRPLFLRVLPARLRMSAWARLYQPPHPRWHALYREARLLFAPRIQIDLIPGDIISDSIAFTGIYELHHSKRVAELAELGGTLVDIGANLGYFSLLWAAHGNRCISFEASPKVLRLLKRNVALNRLESLVEVVPHAAGDRSGTALFDLGPEEQSGWGGLSKTGTTPVSIVRCDDLVNEDIALLKIDIEGADTLALKGCRSLLMRRMVKLIWFEENKPRMRKLGIERGEAARFLRSVGYSAWPETDPEREIVDWVASPII